jgi:sterol desaturase/sphingolipid hydroxylase (fatty acid hydroxylase superfamily)
MDVVQASIPLFFGLIALELLVAKVRGDRVYRLNDSIADLSLGTASQLIGIFLAVATITVYGWVAARWSIQGLLGAPAWIDRTPFPTIEGWRGIGLDGWALVSWGAVFLLDDLAYYWVHRSSHEVNLLWAGHVVHHSSEEYNLTVALRQSSLHGLFSWVFYLPLALVGVPVTMWIVCHGLNLIYQFWIHTREIDRLPRWLEAFLNTPSHHRVHHGINPQYQDKNYAGVFIIWDRLFGTFEPEGEAPVYGITKPLASWNPVWANLHVFVDIARTAWRAPRWSDKLRAIFGRPGWKPAALGGSDRPRPVSVATYQKFDPPAAPAIKVYATAQFAVIVVAAVLLLSVAGRIPVTQTLAGVFYLVLSLSNIGGLLEGQGWASVSELARLFALAAIAATLLASGRGEPVMLAGLVAFALASTAWVIRLRPRLGRGGPSPA